MKKVLLLVPLMSWSCALPTTPSSTLAPEAVPYFRFTGVAAPDTEARAPQIWEGVAACAAQSEGKTLDPHAAKNFPVDVVQGHHLFDKDLVCSGVNAWGCFRYSDIAIVKVDHALCTDPRCPTTASIFQHESLHLALFYLNATGNLDHANKAFNVCDPGVSGVGVESREDTWALGNTEVLVR